VTERLMVAVLKTAECKSSVGSNPTASLFNPRKIYVVELNYYISFIIKGLTNGEMAESQVS